MGRGSDTHSTSRDRSDESRHLSRRQWLALSGAGFAGLAGCVGGSGSGDTDTAGDSGGSTSSGDSTNGGDSTSESDSTDSTGSSTSSGGGSSGTPKDDVLSRSIGDLPTDVNWNFFITGYTSGLAAQLFHRIRPPEMPVLEDWEYDTENQVERWTMPENLTWWNDKPVTAEDEYVKAEIGRLQDPSTSSYESIELEDDYTLAFTYKEPQNPTLVKKSNALGTPIAVPRWKFQSWLDKYEDASNQEARTSITENLRQVNISSQTVVDEGLGNSPYEMTNVNEQEMVFELREDHPWVEPDQVKKVRTRVITEDSQIIQKQDKLDMGGGLLDPDFSGPDNLQDVIKMPSIQLKKVMFNQTNEHLKKRKVRRGIAHYIDPTAIIQNQAPHGKPLTLQTSMGKRWSPKWLGEDFAKKLPTIPPKSDPKGAKKLLNDAGYKKKGGKWKDPDGKTVSFNVLSTNWGAFVDGSRTVAAQLNEAGFDTQFQALEHGSFRERGWSNMDYDMTYYHLNNWSNHPISYYRPQYPGGLRLAKPDSFRDDIEGWLEAGKERSPFTGRPLKPTIPADPSATKISGDGEQINHYELWDSINTAKDREETVKYLRKLARYTAYDLPHYAVLQDQTGWWGDVDDFDMPVDDSEVELYGSNDYALRKGYIKYKYE